MPMTTKHSNVVKCNMFLQSLGLVRLPDKSNMLIFTCTKPMVTKRGKVLTYHEGVPHIESHNPLNTQSYEVT